MKTVFTHVENTYCHRCSNGPLDIIGIEDSYNMTDEVTLRCDACDLVYLCCPDCSEFEFDDDEDAYVSTGKVVLCQFWGWHGMYDGNDGETVVVSCNVPECRVVHWEDEDKQFSPNAKPGHVMTCKTGCYKTHYVLKPNAADELGEMAEYDDIIPCVNLDRAFFFDNNAHKDYGKPLLTGPDGGFPSYWKCLECNRMVTPTDK